MKSIIYFIAVIIIYVLLKEILGLQGIVGGIIGGSISGIIVALFVWLFEKYIKRSKTEKNTHPTE